MGAKAIKLGSWDKHPECILLGFECQWVIPENIRTLPRVASWNSEGMGGGGGGVRETGIPKAWGVLETGILSAWGLFRS